MNDMISNGNKTDNPASNLVLVSDLLNAYLMKQYNIQPEKRIEWINSLRPLFATIVITSIHDQKKIGNNMNRWIKNIISVWSEKESEKSNEQFY